MSLIGTFNTSAGSVSMAFADNFAPRLGMEVTWRSVTLEAGTSTKLAS